MSDPRRTVTARRKLALAVVLAGLHRRPAGLRGGVRAHRAARRRLTPLLAVLGPLVTVGYARRRFDARFRLPQSRAARLLLAGHALVGAAAEELAWRAPLIHLRSRRARLLVAVTGGAAFVGTHLPRDGRHGLPVHALNTVSWTVAVLVGGRLRWAVLAHAGYNVAALTLQPPAVPREVAG